MEKIIYLSDYQTIVAGINNLTRFFDYNEIDFKRIDNTFYFKYLNTYNINITLIEFQENIYMKVKVFSLNHNIIKYLTTKILFHNLELV
jgi:hypothetical protein